MCYLIIMSSTFLKCQLDFGALKTPISPGCSLEGLMLKLKLQYFGHLMWKADSFEKRPCCWARLKAGREGDDRGWDGSMASLTQWTWVWVDSRSWWWTGKPGVLQFTGLQRVGHDRATELNWTDLQKQGMEPLVSRCRKAHCTADALRDRPDGQEVLQSMGSERVGPDWVTELTEVRTTAW